MAEEVDIGNVGGKGVASEETLAALVRAVEFMAKKAGYDAKAEAAKVQKLHNAAVKAGTKATKDSVEVIDLFNDEVEEATVRVSAMGRGFNVLVAGISGIVGSLSNFGEELLGSNTELESFARHIPLVGGIMGTLAGILDNTVDSFRNMTNAGIDFGGSIFEVRRMAAQSGLSLETFQQVVTSNSEALALFGGGARGGARAFANVSKIVQGQFGQGLSNLGFTMEQTAEYTADYLDLQRRLGRNQRMTDAQLAQGTADYILMLDRLAKVTGKQRDQIADQLESQQTDVAFSSFLRRLSDDVRENVQESVALMPTEIQGGVRSMFTTGGHIVSEEARTLANAITMASGNVSDFQSIIRDVNAGLKDEGDVTEYFRSLGINLENMDRENLEAMSNLGNAQASMALSFLQMQTLGEGLSDAQQAQLDATNRAENGILDFARRITEVRNEIVNALLDSGIFNLLEKGFNTLINFFTSPSGMASVKTALEDVGSFFNSFIADMQTGGFWNTIQTYFIDGVKSLWDMIKTQLFGSTEAENTQKRDSSIADVDSRSQELRQQKTSLMMSRGSNVSKQQLDVIDQQLADLEAKRNSLLTMDTSATQGLVDSFRPIIVGMIDGVKAEIPDLMKSLSSIIFGLSEDARTEVANEKMSLEAELSAWEAKRDFHPNLISDDELARISSLKSQIADLDSQMSNGGLLGNLLPEIDGLTAGIGIAGGIGLVAGIIALGGAMSAAALPALALGAAIGIGAGGLGYMFDGLANIIESTGESISNIMDSFTRFRTEGINATTDQIERLNKIPADTLHNTAAGVIAMKEALADFGPSTGSTLFSMITGGADTEQMANTTTQIQDLAAAFGTLNPEQITSASSAVTAMGKALVAFASGLAADAGAGILSSIRGWFGGEDDIVNKITGMASALGAIDGSNLIETSTGISSMGISLLESASGINALADIDIRTLERFSKVNFDNLSALGAIDGAKLIEASTGISSMGASLLESASGINAVADIDMRNLERFSRLDFDNLSALGAIDGSNLIEASTGIRSMGASLLESASGINALAEVNMRNLERFSNVNFDNLSSLGEFAQISGLESQFTAINNGVADFENVNAYASAIENLVEQLSQLNEELSRDNNGWAAGTGTNAGDMLGSINMSSQGSSEGIDRLNTLMSQMLVILTQSKELETRIERNTASLGGDLSRGRVTNIR